MEVDEGLTGWLLTQQIQIQNAMRESIEHVNIMLEGRMPKIREELVMLESRNRKLRTKDGQAYEISYLEHLKGVMPAVVATIGYAGAAAPISATAAVIATAAVAASAFVHIFRLRSSENVEKQLNKLVEESSRSGVNVLAIAEPKVVNNPRLQNMLLARERTRHMGVIVSDNPDHMTLSELEASLKEWIPMWQSNVTAELAHGPYLAIRQRLSDETIGRLDGIKIAKLFGLSTSEMGTICGVSKQSFHANATSKGIQEKLEPLAKVARGVLWCGGDESKFKTWLNQPNFDFPEFKGKQLSPLDLIRMGHAQVIADKVQNLLTGHPA